MENKNNFLKGLVIFTVGVAAGAVLAVLFAPKSGKETREQIKDLTEETKEKISEFVKKGEELFSKR